MVADVLTYRKRALIGKKLFFWGAKLKNKIGQFEAGATFPIVSFALDNYEITFMTEQFVNVKLHYKVCIK